LNTYNITITFNFRQQAGLLQSHAETKIYLIFLALTLFTDSADQADYSIYVQFCVNFEKLISL